jgi:hypothetical protein
VLAEQIYAALQRAIAAGSSEPAIIERFANTVNAITPLHYVRSGQDLSINGRTFFLYSRPELPGAKNAS